MIVKRDILDHDKYRALRFALGGPIALECLIALWRHAEMASGTHPDLILDDAEEVAFICRYRGNATRLKEALLSAPPGRENGFLVKSEVPGMLRIYGWAEQNQVLLSRRNNGKLGGRPRIKQAVTGRLSDGLGVGEPIGPEIRLDEIRVDSPLPPERGGGDEAHRILISAVNLRGVTWEQDLTARKERSDVKDWIPVCKAAAEQSVLATVLNHPGFWVRKFYIGWGREQGSFKHGVPEVVDSAKKNKFRGYSDEPEVKPKGWVSAAGKLNAAGRGPAKPDPGMDGSESESKGETR